MESLLQRGWECFAALPLSSLESEIETGHFQIFLILILHFNTRTKSQLIDQFVLTLLGWSLNRPDTFSLCNIEIF